MNSTITAKSGILRRAKHAAQAGSAYVCLTIPLPPGPAAISMTFSIDVPTAESSSNFASIKSIERLVFGNRQFKFLVPQLCRINYADGIWSHEIPRLNLEGYGKSEEESYSRLAKDLAACWDGIAREKDSVLTDDAIAFKGLLLQSVRVSNLR